MAECGSLAHLIVTLTPEGTATNIVRRRIELSCGLDHGHSGPHRDVRHGEEWEVGTGTGRPPTLLRHEDEEA
jgi:hypothetical protein